MAALLDLGRTCAFARKAAAGSAPYYRLGESLLAAERSERTSRYDPCGAQAWGSLAILKKSFDRYFLNHRVNDLERAIQFLTYFAALAMGHDLMPWSPTAVEELSRGLIGAMDQQATDFRVTNLPIVDELMLAASQSFKRH